MARLFNRQVRVTVDTQELVGVVGEFDGTNLEIRGLSALEITGLRVSFEVVRNLEDKPNTARLKLYNLSPESRRALQKDSVPTVIEAGYPDNIAQIFAGDLRRVSSVLEGTDWVTQMEAGDGEAAMRTARINKSFRKVTFEGFVREAASSLGVGLGNALEKAKSGKFSEAYTELAHGVLLRGQSTEVLDRVLRGAGFEWSVQDGQLQVLELGKALEGTAVLLAPETGLIGSPEMGKGGVVTARSLMQPSLFPGRKVQLQARQVEGYFRVSQSRYVGDTHGDDWHVELEMKAL